MIISVSWYSWFPKTSTSAVYIIEYPNKERHMTSLTKWPPSSGTPGMPFLTSTKNKKPNPHVAMAKTPIARWFPYFRVLRSTSTSPIPLVPLHSWLSRRCWTSPTFVWFFFRCSMRLTSCLFSASRSKPACCSPWALASTWAVKWLMIKLWNATKCTNLLSLG